MGNSFRYVINAVGKGGETYHTYCKDKQELKHWVTENKDRLIMSELKITDKYKHPLLKWISLKR